MKEPPTVRSPLTPRNDAFDAAVAAMLDDARGWRLAEMRKRRGLTQEQVAIRMGVSVARVSQIESEHVMRGPELDAVIADERQSPRYLAA
jgi:DNA-binding XRE family transcriptional regulator